MYFILPYLSWFNDVTSVLLLTRVIRPLNISRQQWRVLLLALIGAGYSVLASAAPQVIDPDASPLRLHVNAIYQDDFNPLLLPEESAPALGIGLNGAIVAKGEGVWYQLDYSANIDAFDTASDAIERTDSYENFRAQFLTRFYLSQEWFLDLAGQHEQVDEAFGTGLSRLRPNIVEADHREENTFLANAVYGNDTSRRYLSIEYEFLDREYDDINDYAFLFDLEQQRLTVDLGFSLSSASRLLFRINAFDDDFQQALRNDSQMQSALVGFSWQASGKTSFSALIGGYRRETDNQEDTSGLSWTLGLNYEPNDYFSIRINSSQDSIVSGDEFAANSVRTQSSIAVNYRFNDLWYLRTAFQVSDTEFEGSLNERTLDESDMSVVLGLEIKSHNRVELSARVLDVEDRSIFIDYDQTEGKLTWFYDF
jgi:hypothetical protein